MITRSVFFKGLLGSIVGLFVGSKAVKATPSIVIPKAQKPLTIKWKVFDTDEPKETT